MTNYICGLMTRRAFQNSIRAALAICPKCGEIVIDDDCECKRMLLRLMS